MYDDGVGVYGRRRAGSAGTRNGTGCCAGQHGRRAQREEEEGAMNAGRTGVVGGGGRNGMG